MKASLKHTLYIRFFLALILEINTKICKRTTINSLVSKLLFLKSCSRFENVENYVRIIRKMKLNVP